MNYKAYQTYQNGKEHICGYGRCANLEEARAKWAKGVKVVEISETELKGLEDAQKRNNAWER